VLALFQGPLADVRFADVDAAVLAKSTDEVESAASAVAQQEARLTELRQALAEKQDALLVLAQRAVAYARVYAEHDDALSEQLASITLPRAAKPRKASTSKSPNAESAPVEVAAVEAAAPPQESAAEPALEDAVAAPSGSRKTKRRLGPPRDAAQGRPS